ncbi:oxidoreductase [Actinomycetota bacterium]|nr:oxidoreductase [Actinomycetota bacterium]
MRADEAVGVRRTLGGTGLEVTALTVGTSGLGRVDRVPEDRAQQTLAAALAGPFAVLDTSNEYGDGHSEERVGRALALAGGLPAGRLVVTKVDPLPGSADFSGDRVRASVEESLHRLGLDHLPLVHLHDPERITFEEAMSGSGPVAALVALRDEGVIGHLGVAGGPAAMMERYVRTGIFEAIVTHNRFTLLDRSAESLLDACAELGLGVFNAAPYGGGLLAGRRSDPPTYAYRPATPEHLAALDRITAACAAHGVDLPAAALQLSIRDPRITSTIVGATRPEQLDATVAWAQQPIPTELWAELDGLCPPERVWLGPDGR